MTDGQTDGPTETPSHEVARTRTKIVKMRLYSRNDIPISSASSTWASTGTRFTMTEGYVITPVKKLSSLTILIQLKAVPRQFELQ